MDYNHRMAYPTSFDDVNTVLQNLASSIQSILGSQFVGLYLYGSLTLGDFDPHTSDIDFIVVTQSELSAEVFRDLHAMHLEFDRSNSPWSRKVEAAYIPLAALKRHASTTITYPQVEKGTELFLAPLEIGWAFQRYTLRERGLVVSGPAPATFTDHVDLAEMQQAAVAILGKWQKQSRQDPDWIAWVRQRSCQAFVVLTICRMLYSLETAAVASKPAAARWVQENSGLPWGALIQRALTGQIDEQEISENELKDTLDFMNEALKCIQKKIYICQDDIWDGTTS